MNEVLKVFLFVCALIVVLFLFACLFNYFYGSSFVTNTHELSDEFNDISLCIDTADIVFLPSEDGKCKVVCYERENQKHSVSATDGTLTVTLVDTRRWYEYISWSFASPKITVYLPEAEYSLLLIEESTGDIEIPNHFKFEEMNISTDTGDVECCASASDMIKIRTSTGEIDIDGISAGDLDLSVSTGDVSVSNVMCEGNFVVKVSTGDVDLTDIICKSLLSSGSTGDICLENVIAQERFSIERSTGDVKFKGCDAAEILVETSTGDVSGTLLSEKIFIAEASTGKIDVPKTANGGRCQITTSTGDIKISIKP